MGTYTDYVRATGAKHYIPAAGTASTIMHFGGTYLTGSGAATKSGLALTACPGIPGDPGHRGAKWPGTSGRVTISSINVTNPVSRKTSDFSVMAWVLSTTGTWSSGVRDVISNWGTTEGTRNFRLEMVDGLPVFRIYRTSVGTRSAIGATTASPYKWHCIIGTMASAANGYDLRVYLDGVEDGYFDEDGTASTGRNDMMMGYNASNLNPSFKQMAHHAWWPRQLSALDIKGLYQAGMTGPSE